MNSHQSLPADLSDCDRCLLYLTGELSESAQRAFESRLATSPELSNELVRQSDSLCVLGATALADNKSFATTKPIEATPRLLKLFMAIAAALTLIVGWSLYHTNDAEPVATSLATSLSTNIADDDEDMLAKAWATTNTEIHFWQDDLDDELDSDAWPHSAVDDSSLSWISSAIESGATIDG